MSKVLTIVLCIALCFSAAAAYAQEGMEGRTEASGAFAYLDVADLSILALAVDYGKFISPKTELQLGVVFADLDGDTLWGLAPQIAYHFIPEEPSKQVPYVGAGFFHLDMDGNTESAWSAFAGMKFFLDGNYDDANQAVFAELRYISDVGDENVFAVWGGFTQFFN